MMVLPGREKKGNDIFIHLDTIHERDGRTDRQTPADSKYILPRLRIASRGKNSSIVGCSGDLLLVRNEMKLDNSVFNYVRHRLTCTSGTRPNAIVIVSNTGIAHARRQTADNSNCVLTGQ